jgi:hydroxymethylpyrimidine/phosphomethylpyrimidine kinase
LNQKPETRNLSGGEILGGHPGRLLGPSQGPKLPLPHSEHRTPNSELQNTRDACVLTVAGSDSSAGAGIQADIKTFRTLGVPGMSVITALTSQNSRGVTQIHPTPLRYLSGQLAAVDSDFDIRAAKTGMMPTGAAISAVAKFFRNRPQIRLVVDPVLIATSGASLRMEDTTQALIRELIPLASVVTPNLDEAQVLADSSEKKGDSLARRLWNLYHVPFLVKGGHGTGAEVADVLHMDGKAQIIASSRLPGEFHGTGCILSAAIASHLAVGLDLKESVARAHAFLQKELQHSIRPATCDLRYLLMK